MKSIDTDVIGRGLDLQDNAVDNLDLIDVNEAIRYTDVEAVGAELRAFMGAMKQL
jgi:ketol-acid reductoisomerase